MNLYKKRLIKHWKELGYWTLSYIHCYKGHSGDEGGLSDLYHACEFYCSYFNVYTMIWEHNI